MSTDGLSCPAWAFPHLFGTALLCIRQHGQSAAYFAAGRADELLDAGAVTGAATWRKILAEIERLQSMEPEGGARH